jgi:hypothetical protein
MAVSLLPKDFGNLQLIQNYSNFSVASYKVECFSVSLAYSCQSFPFTHRIHVVFTKKVLFIFPAVYFLGTQLCLPIELHLRGCCVQCFIFYF